MLPRRPRGGELPVRPREALEPAELAACSQKQDCFPAMARDPSARYPTAAALAADHDAWRTDLAEQARALAERERALPESAAAAKAPNAKLSVGAGRPAPRV